MKWLQILTFVMVAILFVGFIGIAGSLLGWWEPQVACIFYETPPPAGTIPPPCY